MTIIVSRSWESMLLEAAFHARDTGHEALPLHVNAEALTHAYGICDAITKQHSHTFYLASQLLPVAKRQAMRALYAFCRVSDDIVDLDDTTQRQARLQAWRSESLAPRPSANQFVALAWADTRMRFHIPIGYAEQLITGVERDLTQTRYQTFNDLAMYAYGVASTVGLMAMHIIGYRSDEAIAYAVKLGVALQLTNIMRDVGQDWTLGRLYLPQDEIAHFGLTEADIAAGRIDDRWREFLTFQLARIRQLYVESLPGIPYLNKDGRFAVTAAAQLYQAILSDIEQHDGDVFNRRAHISTMGKLRLLPGIWWQSRREI